MRFLTDGLSSLELPLDSFPYCQRIVRELLRKTGVTIMKIYEGLKKYRTKEGFLYVLNGKHMWTKKYSEYK